MHVDIRVAGPGPWDMAERARLIQQKVPQLVAAGATVVREELDGEIDGVAALRIEDGRVTGIHYVRNPEKLSRIES